MAVLLNKIMEEEKIPTAWNVSTLVTIYKEKGDAMHCKNYRGIKLLEVGLKVLEKILDKRLRHLVNIVGAQFGFQPGKGTIDAIFILRQLQEKVLEKREKEFLAFLDLEKAYDRVPRDVVNWCMRKRGIPEKLISLVRATYEHSTTRVRTRFGDTNKFEIKVGLHQGSALSPFLFIVVLDTLTDHISTGIPWELIFADDIALVGKTGKELREKVIKWQTGLKSGGLKMSAEKTETLVMERKQETVVKIVDLNGRELTQVDHFKYLALEMEAEGGSWKAVMQRVKIAWMKWREMSGIICDRKILRKLKSKIYRTVLRPVLLYGAEWLTMRKKEDNLLRRTEMRMLRWILGISLKDKIRNEEIRRRCGVVDIAEKVRETRLKWYGQITRRDNGEPVRDILELDIKGNRGRGRPKKRWIDCVKEDLNEKELTVDMKKDRIGWRSRIRAADPGTVWD